MKYGMKVGALSVIVLACAPVVTSATVIFNDDFDAGTSGTRYDQFNQDNDTAADPPFDTSANFNFNYGAFTYWHIAADESTQNASSLIPSAPRSTGGSTTGRASTPTVQLRPAPRSLTCIPNWPNTRAACCRAAT